MKAKVLLFAAALLLIASSAFAQGYAGPMETTQTLTTRCDNSVPLPEGTVIYVYQRVGATISDTDPLAPLNEVTGVTGDLNINTNTVNGPSMGWGDGQFTFDQYLVSQNAMPTNNNFYLRIYYPNLATWNTAGGVMYVSNTFSLESNIDFADKEMGPWTCVNGGFVNPCTQTPEVALIPNHNVGNQVPVVTMEANMCVGGQTLIKVGPVVRDNRLPRVMLAPCATNAGAADIMALPTNFAWQWVGTTGTAGFYQAVIHGTVEGCVTVNLEFLLPVEMGEVSLVPGDNKATINWNTRSETSLARFEVMRDGEFLTALNANNTTTGSSYTYEDATAENRHVYTYQIVAVGLDGSRDMKWEGKAAPDKGYEKPTEYALNQNYPNPFNPTTSISFDIVDNNPVTLMVYNATGQLVSTLLNNVSKESGRYTVSFDATNLTSGLYFYTIKVGNVYSSTKKMMLVK